MDFSIFQNQINRLRTEWKNAYGEERTKMLWLAFKNENETVFADAVTECLVNSRGAPLLNDLEKAVNLARNRRAQSMAQRECDRNAVQIVLDAQRVNRVANRDFVKEAVKLLGDYTSGKITKTQFEEGCDYLDGVAGAFSKT